MRLTYQKHSQCYGSNRFTPNSKTSLSLFWTKGMKIRDQSIEEYLNDVESMLETRTVWMDGQAGVMWLS